MKHRRPLAACPVCDGTLQITELACGRCGTVVRGEFARCRFCALPADQIDFVETFLRCEGNLSRVEKELGVSYPTVRNRLTAAIAALGFGPPAEGDRATPDAWGDRAAARRAVLDAVAAGELTSTDAVERLRETL